MNLETCGIITSILGSHWIADFILQTDWQAKNKSKSWKALLTHTGIYSSYMMVSCFPLTQLKSVQFSFVELFLFGLITFIAHTITDAITSRMNSYLWQKGDLHNFFVGVGFDQFLHAVQLIFTLYVLV